MIQRFSPNLDKVDISANGNELASIMGRDRNARAERVTTYPQTEEQYVTTFKQPVLVTDNFLIGQLPPALRDTVFALYQSPVRITQYDSTTNVFEQRRHPGVWGPNIDTLLFCRGLKNIDLAGKRTATEIGAGSGFISQYLLDHAPDIERIDINDFNPQAILSAHENISDPRATFSIMDGLMHLEGKRYDLIVCNPPYIPRPKSIDKNQYEGLSLLRNLIANAGKNLNPGGVLVTNFSSLSRNASERFCDEADCSMIQVDSLKVPLKVFNVLNNPEWLGYLKENGLRETAMRGYDYWHEIAIMAIRPRTVK